jgi:hypothetical protein
MKNADFWDVAPCGSCKNRRFGGTLHLHHQGDKNRRALRRNTKSLITTKLLDFVHRPDFYKPENTTFRKLDLFPSSGGGGENREEQ